MKTRSIFFIILILTNLAKAQNKRVMDSLITISNDLNKHDTVRATAFYWLSFLTQNNNISESNKYANKMLKISEKSSHFKFMALAKLNIANNFFIEGKTDSAEYYFKKLIPFGINHVPLIAAACYSNLSVIKSNKLDYKGAIEDNILALKIYEKNKGQVDEGIAYINLSDLYFKIKNWQAAKECIIKSISFFKGNGKEYYLKNSYSNFGIYFDNIKNSDSAIYFFNKSIQISEKVGDVELVAGNYGNKFSVFMNLKLKDSLLSTVNKQHYYALKTNNINNIYFSYYNYKTYYEQYTTDKVSTLRYLDSIKKYVSQVKLPEYHSGYYKERMSYEFLYGNKDSAFHYLNTFISFKDSLGSSENSKIVEELNKKYETQKKDSQIQTQSLEIESKEKQNKQKSLIILFGALGLLATGVFGGLAFVNFKKTKKQNLIIENQKQQVELKNEEISHQKEIVEEKQKEIIDSINYAKRIQQAVLTGEDVWNKISKEHFILFKPKDIVSGDFYWAYNTPNGRSIFALADCTGHGVPGGFMSMLGNSFLNEIVVENKIFKANEILNKLREKVISALEQKGQTDQKDGMDISLCVWNKMDNTLEFAGANNPLWLLRASTSLSMPEITEYKADKMPIGTYIETQQPFQSTTIQLQANDIIYLSTDGYADQFGGPKGKKFKYKPLMELLIANHSNTMNSQKIILEEAFNTWKNKQDQVDDIAVIGIKII